MFGSHELKQYSEVLSISIIRLLFNSYQILETKHSLIFFEDTLCVFFVKRRFDSFFYTRTVLSKLPRGQHWTRRSHKKKRKEKMHYGRAITEGVLATTTQRRSAHEAANAHASPTGPRSKPALNPAVPFFKHARWPSIALGTSIDYSGRDRVNSLCQLKLMLSFFLFLTRYALSLVRSTCSTCCAMFQQPEILNRTLLVDVPRGCYY